MFWVRSVYFNIRNTLPKSGTFLLGHPVYRVYWPRPFVISLYQSTYLKHNSCYTVQCCSFRYTRRSVHAPSRVEPQQKAYLKQQKPLSVQKGTVNPDLTETLINRWWLLVSRQETWKCYMEWFEFKTLNDVEVREKVPG